LELFKASQTKDGELSVVQPYQQRYWAWANQLKFFAKRQICLDAQLKDHKFDRLRHAIFLLLDLLRDNLDLSKPRSRDYKFTSLSSKLYAKLLFKPSSCTAEVLPVPQAARLPWKLARWTSGISYKSLCRALRVL
jgi:hypothetical protein